MAGKMRMLVCLILTGLLVCLFLGGCTPTEDTAKTTMIATSFPAYDFARRLTAGCDGIAVKMLLKPGTESHSYDPSAADMMAVADAALFLYIGQGADLWAERMMDTLDDVPTFALTDGLPLLSVHEDHGHGDDAEMDPHVWTSPKNAVQIAGRLADTLKALPALDAAAQAQIETNRTAFVAELEALDAAYQTFADSLAPSGKMLIFGDRFPFRYLARDYGFSYKAAFPGCSEESEPAASTVASLIDTVRAENITTVFYVEFSQHRIADTIAQETGAKTALLHSCHNVTRPEFDAGETYLSLMQKNLTCLENSFISREN